MKDCNYKFEYKGYTIEYHYQEEEDCIHECCIVRDSKGKWLEQFNWAGCEEKAKKYIDEVLL